MKVLQINITCGIGSTGRIATNIDEILRQKGDESYIAYGYYKSNLPNTKKLKYGNSKYSVYIELMKTRLTGYHGFTSKGATRKLIRWIEEIKPDIIHLHNLHCGYLHIGMFFKYLSTVNIPIIWTLHDCWSFTGHCSHFSAIGCEKWKTGCYNCPDKNGYPKRIFFDRSKEQWKKKKQLFTSIPNMTLVTPSNWLLDLVKKSYLREYPVFTIYNGIDLGIFKPIKNNIREKFEIENKKIVLAVAASWSERKGLKYVLEVAAHLDEKYQVIIVGLNKQQKKSLPPNVIGIDKTNNVSELAEIYTVADVFINPTLEEVLGLTNIEALACETPVITFDTGGSVECVDKDTGIIIDQGDTKALINSIIDICENGKLGTGNYRKRAEKMFNKHDRYEDYYNLYLSTIR